MVQKVREGRTQSPFPVEYGTKGERGRGLKALFQLNMAQKVREGRTQSPFPVEYGTKGERGQDSKPFSS